MNLFSALTHAVDWLVQNHPVRIGIVANNSDHSPGTAGATLVFVPHTDQFAGTIGGGVMEAEYIARSSELPNTPTTETLVHKAKVGPGQIASGLFCAGDQVIVSFGATTGDRTHHALTQFIDAHRAGAFGSLVVDETDVKFQSADTTAPPDEQIGYAEESDRFSLRVEAQNLRRVAIAGGGHCGLALARTMFGLGYDVTVFETRSSLRQPFDALGIGFQVVPSFDAMSRAMVHTAKTHVVVMTSNVDDDIAALLSVSTLSLPYCGVMGSVAKIARIRSTLTKAGAPQSFLENLHAPIGLPMRSNTPPEIAISVAGEILSLNR